MFGYEYTAMEGDAEYHTINGPGPGPGPGNTIGGVGGMDGLPDDVPAHWDTYFMVRDADGTVTAATAKGGSVSVPAFGTPFGRMAAITDPQGATFWVMQDTSGMMDAG